MEASALHAPAGLSRFPRGGGLLRLRSDEQLVAAFRSGNDEAFRIIHDRYRQRLFAYVRQMLAVGSRQDAEDVLQDVFVRAYGALRNDNREMNVRAWLYRVAHNRCIDHLRRPVPPAAEIFEVSRKPLHDPVEEAQRRDDLRRLVADVGNLPEQQRSALLMREIDGMTYADLASALDVTVPAVKSLLVRARVGLVEAAGGPRRRLHRDPGRPAARLRPRREGVRPRAQAHALVRRLHASTAAALRGMRRSFAALAPVGVGPLALAAKVLGIFGGGGAAAGGAAAGGGGAAVAGGGLAAGDGVQGRRGGLHGGDRHRRRRRGQAPGLQRPGPGREPRSPRRRSARPSRPRSLRPCRRARRPPAGPDARARARPPRRRAAQGGARSRPSPRQPRKLKAVPPAPPAKAGEEPETAPAAPAATPDPQLETGGARAPDAPPAPTPAPVADARGDAAGARGADARAATDPAPPTSAGGARRRRRPAARARARRSAPPVARLGAHRRLPRTSRARVPARPPRTPLRPVHDGRRPLDGARPRAGRLPDVDLRRLARRGPRRAAAVARDDLQGRGRRPAARRRQGRDHAAPRRGRAHAGAPRRPCWRTSATPSRRSAATT